MTGKLKEKDGVSYRIRTRAYINTRLKHSERLLLLSMTVMDNDGRIYMFLRQI